MPKQCTICGKQGRLVQKRVKLRGKYNPTIKKRQHPNLQKFLVPLGTTKKLYSQYAGKRVLTCAKCIKTLAKRK
ncbi:hypothetical protein KKB68_02605 [Patescibacteria group bacterium]|nr:hypothetical protein [Patescibacteria group bacterium]